MPDVFGTVLRCQKGQGQDEAVGNPVLLVRQRHGSVQLAWRVFVVGKQTEIWSGRWSGYRIEIFFMSWTR